MNIAININEAYLQYAMVMLKSLFCNNSKERVTVHLLNASMGKEAQNTLREFVEKHGGYLQVYDVDLSLFEDFPDVGRWALETYFRLLLPEYLPENMERVLYLDADIIVNGSLTKLYQMDFRGHSMVVCPNTDGTVDEKEKNLGWSREENIAYFNAGVMLLNLKKMRKQCDFKTYASIAKRMPDKIPLLDQDLLNYVYGKDVEYVSSEVYNYIVFSDREVKRDGVVIYHFGTKEKPWHKECDDAYHEIWWQYNREIQDKKNRKR